MVLAVFTGSPLAVDDGRGTLKQRVQALHAGFGRRDLGQGVLDHLETGVHLCQALPQLQPILRM